jgi:hypothetical protein
MPSRKSYGEDSMAKNNYHLLDGCEYNEGAILVSMASVSTLGGDLLTISTG